MSPESKDDQANQNDNPTPPQGDSLPPPPPASPGGVIKPTGNESSPQAAPPSDNTPPPPPDNPVENTVPPQDNNMQQNTPPPQNSPAQSNPPSGQPQTGPGPAQPGGSEIFPSDPVGPVSGGTKSGFSKKRLLLIAAPVLLVLLIAGYIFGFYIPNKPENVYKTGLDRSGDALEVIINQATEQETYDQFKSSEITATMDMNFDGQNVNGDFRAKYNETKLDADLNASFPAGDGTQQADLGFSVLSTVTEGKEFPDTYLNFRGLKALGADFFLPGIGKYDNRWLAISSDYLQSIADQYGIEEPDQQDNTDDYPTSEEISALARDVYGDINEYVLTSDPEKAVLENRQYLGKEEVEGVDSYHYEVAVNKENYKAACEAVSNTLLSSPAYKKFLGSSDEQIEAQKQKIGEDCQSQSDAIKSEDTFEMWVDSKYKLIKRIRIYDGEDKQSYFDIGQNYDGSDKVGLFFAYGSQNGGFNSKVTFTTDFNTAESSGEITFNGGEGDGAYDGTITVNAKPLSEDFEITKPDNTVNIEKLLQEFGIDPQGLASLYGGNPVLDATSGVNSKAQDATVKSNLLTIYSNLEVYFAENAAYPSNSQFNDQSWRAANLAGVSDDMLSGSITYNPSDCSFGECQSYTLVGRLSDGSTFERTSSNN